MTRSRSRSCLFMRNSSHLISPQDRARALVLPLLFSCAFHTFSNRGRRGGSAAPPGSPPHSPAAGTMLPRSSSPPLLGLCFPPTQPTLVPRRSLDVDTPHRLPLCHCCRGSSCSCCSYCSCCSCCGALASVSASAIIAVVIVTAVTLR
jgi:hypothetical protein